MGDGIVKFYVEKIEKKYKIAFFSSVIVGLITHIYKFMHFLPNHDSIHSVWSSLDIITSGRWFLAVACFPSGFFDLPWINGILSLIWIGITAAVIVSIFDIKNTFTIILASSLLVVFPAITGTFFYEFTADGYMFAMLLAALAVRFLLVGDRSRRHMAVAAVLICFACGVYQAYLSFALMLSICHFMRELLKNERDKKEYRYWVGRQIVVYAVGVVLYYLIWKGLMAIRGLSAVNYNGIGQIGQFSAETIKAAVIKTVQCIVKCFVYWNVFEYGWTLYAVMSVIFLAMAAFITVYAVIKTGLVKRKGDLALFALCLAAMPFFICIWNFASPGVSYYWLMLQSLAVFYIFVFLLYDDYSPMKLQNAAALFFVLLVCKLSLQANICYFEMNRAWENTRTQAVEMISRIHMAGEPKKVAVIGGEEKSYADVNSPIDREIFGYDYMINTHLLYDQVHALAVMGEYLGSYFVGADEEECRAVSETEEFAEMGVWPSADSVRIIDGIAVVKLS